MLTQADSDSIPVDDYIYLTGRPPVTGFIRFIKSRTVDGQLSDEFALANEWRQAREQVIELQSLEKGWADNPTTLPLSDDMARIAAEEMADPVAQRIFRHVPREWRLVEIDRLVVFQKWVNQGYVEDVKAALPS